jgi:hypothetical protein
LDGPFPDFTECALIQTETLPGYSLTGATVEQSLLLLQGQGANGKSTLIETMLWVFGDYGLTLPFASLLHDERRRGGEATPDLARLPGARLVVASEPEVNARFSESLIKQFTGCDRISVRHLNQGFFDFHPKFKLVLAFNNRPQIRGHDSASGVVYTSSSSSTSFQPRHGIAVSHTSCGLKVRVSLIGFSTVTESGAKRVCEFPKPLGSQRITTVLIRIQSVSFWKRPHRGARDARSRPACSIPLT